MAVPPLAHRKRLFNPETENVSQLITSFKSIKIIQNHFVGILHYVPFKGV
jgi:hypothetical protein